MYLVRLRILIVLLTAVFSAADGQTTEVSGRIIDYTTKETLPFANVFFKGSLRGVVANDSGYFFIRTTIRTDSLMVMMLGYNTERIKIKRGRSQKIVVEMKPGLLLKGIEVKSGENPAVTLMRKVIAKKYDYHRNRIDAYSAQVYTKLQVDVNNVTDWWKRRRFFRPVAAFFNRLDSLNGPDEKAHMPIYLAENLEDVVFDLKKKTKQQKVNGINVNFVGKQLADLAEELSSSDLQDYYFLDNYIMFLRKGILSPLADGALLFYRFQMSDTTWENGHRVFKIVVHPRNDRDLVFTGNIWIQDTAFKLLRVDLQLPSTANINLVESLTMQQSYTTVAGSEALVSEKLDLTVGFYAVSSRLFGAILKTHIFAVKPKLTTIEKDLDPKEKVQFDENVLQRDANFWKQSRPTPFSEEEEDAIGFIDTLSNLPALKFLLNTAVFIGSGHKPFGPIELGTLQTLYMRNAVEGQRVRLSFRTNRFFSNRWIFRGYGAYGFLDKRFKYNIQAEYIITRRPWIKLGIQRREDNDQLGLVYPFSRPIALGASAGSLYNIASQIGSLTKFMFNQENRIWADADLFRGVGMRVVFQRTRSIPLFQPENATPRQRLYSRGFRNTEARLEVRYAPDERYVQNGNERVGLNNMRLPVWTLQWVHAFPGFMGGQIRYDKITLGMNYRIQAGPWGMSELQTTASQIFGSVPFPLLDVPRGNETSFFSAGIFNTMNFFEFLTDRFVSVNYQHHFMGLFFNRLPLIKRLRLREVVSLNALWGDLSTANLPEVPVNTFTIPNRKPFAEVGIGIENIAWLLRVDLFYRLTYVDANYVSDFERRNPTHPVAPWQIKFSLGFRL